MLLRVSSIYGFVGFVGVGLALSACSSGDTPASGTAGTGNSPGASGSATQAGTAGVGTAGASTAGTGTGGAAGTAGTSPVTTGGTNGGATTGGNGTGGGQAGVGGSVGTAGAGGTAGTGTGGGGTAGTGGADSHKSAGCGKDAVEDPTKWTTHDVTVPVAAAYTTKFGMRRYFTRPPMNYDKNTPTILTIWGQGCQQSVAEDTPMTKGPGAASIQLQLLADPDNKQCYSAGPDGDMADSPELPYFDKALADVLDAYCVDTSKIFMGGYSSGGWVSSLIGCNRANVVRGVGWAAAGLQLNHAACTGSVAALITRGMNDNGTPLAQTEAARDDLITRNGCTTTTKPWLPGETAFDTSSCVEYQGCKPGYPVVWCPTPGQHTNTVNDTKLTPQGLWKFWTTLPTP